MSPIRPPQLTIPDMIAGNGKWIPDQIAWVYGERRVTWKEFSSRVNRVANALIGLGVGKGDRVAVLMTDSIETAEILFGVVRAGAVVVPLSPMVTPQAIERMVADSGSKALFVNGLLQAFPAQFEKPYAARLISVGFKSEGWTSYDELMAGASEEDPNVPIAFDDDYIIVYSSGTTGVPKGIVHTHLSRLWLVFNLGLPYRIDRNTVTILTTPLFTNGTWVTMLPTVVAGGTNVIMGKFEPKAFLDLAQKEKATHSVMVPTQYIVTMAHPEFKNADLSSLQCLISVGSTLHQEVRERILKNFDCEFYELYGLTEGVGTMLRREEMLRKPSSVGKPGLGNDILILDEVGRELPPGLPGEITGYAGGLMKGYHNRPDLTDEIIWKDPKGRTYLRTGDIGKMDEEGFLYILDRKKDMIVSGGINIFAKDIEDILTQHSDVLDVTVIGLPHEKWGETPVALVIRNTDAKATAEELKEWANAKLAKYQRVSGVFFRDEFPRNALGKVMKRLLREELSHS
jgi:acyl-CoA synthetase (AMP-forming)/AMP-acid ligase II